MKKRILSMFLAVCLLITTIPVSAMSAFTADIMYGDADNNNKVDLQDVVLIERYINGEEGLTIDSQKADVNADGAIDKTDVELIREYLVGNLATLTPVLCTIFFNTDGGDEITSIQTGKGYTRKAAMPTATKTDFVFVGWKMENGDTFYQSDYVITSDITLTAVYQAVESKQMLSITSFSLENQKPDVSFLITGDFANETEVKENLTLLTKDGSAPVEAKVKSRTDLGENIFEVYTPDGFNEGATYELTLNEKLSFVEKDQMYRTVYFNIKKDEIDNLKFNPDMKFIKDTEEMKYTIDGDTANVQEVLESALLDNSENQDAIEGTFDMSGGGLSAGDVVCIYETTPPNQRDYTQSNYENDALAYIRIISALGNTYRFASLNEDDIDDVLAMPDTIVYQVATLPIADGTVNKNDYDTYARTVLGQENAPEFNVYDFLVFYTGDFNSITENSPVVYGQITSSNGNQISYKIVTKDYIENFTGMYILESVEADPILAEINQNKILNSIKKQAEDSGFVQQAANQMAKSAFQTQDMQNRLKANGVTDEEINTLAETPGLFAAPGGAGGTGGTSQPRTEVVVEGVSVVPTFSRGEHFKEGIGITLDICLTLSIDTKVSASKQSSLKIELMASFEQELALDFSVNIDNDLTWIIIIPKCSYFNVSVSVDVQNYTSVSVGAKMYTVSEDIVSTTWKPLSETMLGTSPVSAELREKIKKINALGVKAKKLQSMGENAQDILDQIKGYKDSLPKVEYEGVTYDVNKLEEALGAEDVSAAFDDVFSAKDETEAKTGLEQLMTKYQDMLNQECDWVEIFNKEIFNKSIYIKLVEIKIGVNFIVRGNVNLSIGADIEYEVGKRYCFWVDIIGKTSGSSEIDLIDERFGFQFYVMGTLGLKAGIKAEIAVGIISTRIASVGASVDFGIYLRLWGYFVYYFEDLRPANSVNWNEKEEMLGALYLEFGLYLNVKFKAQVFDNAFKYEPTLYDNEFPLVTAGEKQNVYDFNEQPESKDVLYVKDSDADSKNGVTMTLPSKYRNMKTIDLCSGDKIQQVYPLDKFIITFSDSRFSINKQGIITVNVPDNTRYLKCDMRIVWICDKVAFSKYDTDITVPLIWTNMTEEEQTEQFTASVAVGNLLDGYNTVWSDKFTRLDSFDLPNADEILKLMNYYSYNNENGVNVKYNDAKGYQGDSTGLSITSDTTYYFDITPKTYELTVNGIQKPDGTTYSKTFKTKYGQGFDLTELQTTGKNNQDKSEYTIFKNVTTADGIIFDFANAVDLSFVKNYGTKANVTANYLDDSLTATFNFVGLGSEIAPKQIKFKKGTTPNYADLLKDIEAYGGTYDGIYPAIAPSESSVSYTVKCKPIVPEVTYSLTYNRNYNVNDNETIAKQSYAKDGKVFYPVVSDRVGYTFAGWYTDRECQSAFSADEKMPANDLTLYAKWTANLYNLSFETKYGKAPENKSILFDSQYSELTNLYDENFMFLGWFTEKDGGIEIKNGDKFTIASNQTLYAQWGSKTDLKKYIDSTQKSTSDYNETAQSYKIHFNNYPGTKDLIAIQYKKQNTSEWSSDAPINAGVYDIKLTNKPYNTAIAELYNKYTLSQEITINSGLTINKIDLPQFSDPSVFTDGGAVSIGRPDGIKGDGVVNYALYTHQTSIRKLVSKSTNGFISNLSAGTYYACVEVDSGTNYNARNSGEKEVYVNGTVRSDYKAEVTITTTDGTDSDIYAGLYYAGEKDPGVELCTDSDDFEAGDVQIFELGSGLTPWEITGAYIYKAENKGVQPEWSFTSTIQMKQGDTVVSKQGFLSKDSVGEDQTMQMNLSFGRIISAVGNFRTGGSQTIDLNSSTKYTYNYNSLVTDQYMTDYNAMKYYGAPDFNVTCGNPVFDRFIKYTGVTSFEIDTVAMAEYIKKYGGTVSKFYVNLNFPSKTVGNMDIAKYQHQISVENAPNQTYATYASSGLSAKMAPMMMSLTGTNNAEFTLTANDIAKLESDTFEIPVMLQNNPSIWGILANVEYDHNAFELLSCSAGDVFDEDMFTMKKDLSNSPFTFLATKKTLDSTSSDGTLVTLRFKVKPNADQKNKVITINMLQAVNELGQVQAGITKSPTVVLDNVNPTGAITVGDNEWKSLLNTITFGLFFKNTQSVEISADDKESGVKSVEYYITNSEVADVNQITATDWKKYENSFDINPDNTYVIYAKITDNADNEIIINSNGIVLDDTKPEIKDILDGESYYKDMTFTFSDNYLESVIVDDNPIDIANGSYTIIADNKQHTIVATDKAGNETTRIIGVYKTYTVTLNSGAGYTFEPQGSSTSPVNYDGSFSFKLIMDKNYESTKDFAVKVNGTAVTADASGVYTIIGIQDNQTVSVEGVVIKPADYSKVDEAIAQIPTDLSIYTEVSVKALNDAKNAVVNGKNITEQTIVDGYATVIENAISGLSKKPITSSPDTNFPQTGDISNMALWIALLFVSGGALTAFGISKKCKKSSAK